MSETAARYRHAPSVLSRSVAEEILLAVPDAEDLKALSGTARVIWLLLDEPRSADDLAVIAGELYGVPRNAVIDDIERLLGELAEWGLAERMK